jgi:hypothetical protein
MDGAKTATGATEALAQSTAGKSGRGERGRRRSEMTSANARYFLTKPGTSPEKPELGREMTSEAEALVEAFKTGQPFFTLVAWKAVSEIDNGAPKIVKEALKRS